MNVIRSLVRGSNSSILSSTFVRPTLFKQPALITPFSAYTRSLSNSLIRSEDTITEPQTKANYEAKTKANVHDLETFFKAIGRDTVEHLELFDSSLSKFLKATSKQMKEMGIETRTRRYMLRWRHKFENDLEPLREHKRGTKKNGGQRKSKAVIAKRRALERIAKKEEFAKSELDAETRGERLF
ncbi:Protein FYV4 mitochondrial [Spathaspora sp. JA1]|nr:Protein FYV4 mitochondrial [Spathaspora sp. JA1]